ncbi:MAG: glycosyltransferase, partial [Actinomycetota bacterium]
PEEFSLVTAEAQAMELPVVATGPGGPSEVLVDGETGFIVAPGVAVALAVRIHELVVDGELRERMGVAGRVHVSARFDRETYAVKVADALTDLLERRS